MSKRNQPYLPLYVQDFLTDEKLMECSASSTGVYIRIMCIMHKSQEYGKILLKQNFKQKSKQIQNFATYLVRFLPYSFEEIESALEELINADVLQINGDCMSQKRMVKDGEISLIRSLSGSIGGKKAQSKKNIPLFDNELASNFAKAKPKAKHKANSENEIEYEDEIENEIDNKKETKWQLNKKKFLNSIKWKNDFCSAKKLTLQELDIYLLSFLEMLDLRKEHKSVSALYRHFTNYYNKIKQNESDKRNNQKPKFGTAIREAGSRMGEIGNSFGKEIA